MTVRRRLWKLFCNPYLQIGLGALLVTLSELLMKTGAASQDGRIGLFGIAALASGWTWLGIISYCLSFASWVHVLRTVPLGVAYGLINVTHVLIPLGCWFFLHEDISPRRWLGIALVLAGLLLVVRPLARVEQKLEATL
jgi:multidrug transporter EmrE-like cation transporter